MELFVSFSEIVDYFKARIVKFILILAAFAIVFGLIPLKFVHHQYSADTTIVISCEIPENSDTDYRLQFTNILYSRVQTGVAIASDKSLITQTAEKLGVDEKKITSIEAEQLNNAPVIKLTASCTEPEITNKVSNTAAEILSNQLKDNFPSPTLSAIITDKGIPVEPQSNKTTMLKSGILGVIVGLIICLCYGIIATLADKTIKNSRYVSEAMNLALLGTLPLKDKKGSYQNSMRKLRAAVINKTLGKNSILVTDVCKDNGALSTSIGLAGSVADSGKEVLLIDADLRTNQVAEKLNVKVNCDLSEVLNGACTAEQAISKTSINGLSVITGISKDKDASDLLFSDEFAKMFNELSQKYDYVVVHAQSEVSYPDADNIARLFGSVIMVAKYGSTPYQDFKDSYSRLETAGGNIIGFVTTNV